MRVFTGIVCLAAAILVLAPVSGNACDIPFKVMIMASDACAAWQRVQSGWAESQKRMWYALALVQMVDGDTAPSFKPIKIEEAGLLFVIEHDSDSFIASNGSQLLGAFYLAVGIPVVEYAVKSSLRPWEHEIDHFRWWVERDRFGDQWQVAGHGVADDPYVQAPNRAVRMLFDPLPQNHPYWPGQLPMTGVRTATFQSAGFCGVSAGGNTQGLQQQ